MKLSKPALIGLAVAAVIAVVVAILLFMNLSSPKARTVTIAPRKVTVDEATARKEIDRRISDYRAKGEPILLNDFIPKPVPVKDNAADAYLAAIKWLDRPEIDNDPVWNLDIDVRRLSPAQWQQLDAAVIKFAPALALIDQADGLQAADWHIKFASPSLQILLPALNGARQSANLLQMAALTSWHAGRHDETVHRLTQLLLLARHADNGHPFLVGHLVGCGICRMATQTIADVVPTLQIAPTTSATTQPGFASQTQVKELIAALLDPRTLETGWRQATFAERMSQYDITQCLIDGRLNMQDLTFTPKQQQRPATAIPTPPAAELLTDLAPMLDHMTKLLIATRADRLPEFRRLQPIASPSQTSPLGRILTPTYDRAALTHFTALTHTRLAAAALAARAYAADHYSALPPSLDVLVPQYLPRIPNDPMVAAPAIIQYRDNQVFSAGVDESRRLRVLPRSGGTTKPAPAAAKPTAATKPDFAIRIIP